MELCVLAKFVLVLAILSLVFHVCIFGITVRILADILFMTLLVFITNRYCDSWIAKGISIFAIIGSLAYFSMCSVTTKAYQPKIGDDPNQPRNTVNRRKLLLLNK